MSFPAQLWERICGRHHYVRSGVQPPSAGYRKVGLYVPMQTSGTYEDGGRTCHGGRDRLHWVSLPYLRQAVRLFHTRGSDCCAR